MSAGDSPNKVMPSKDNEKKPDDERKKKAAKKAGETGEPEKGEAEEEQEQKVQSLDDTAAQPAEEQPQDEDPEAKAEREKERRRALQQRFWISAVGFWKGGDRLAWPFTIGLFLLVLLTVAAQYGVNVWNRAIFDGLEKREAGRVFTLALIFFPLAAASVGLGVAAVYCRMTMQRRWRAWLSDHMLDAWLKNGRYYQLNLVSGDHQNPEGRLTDDLRVSTDAPIDFAV
ncbi:MAG: ABC transporter ATP-binding protein/permease, partial [Pseudorhodoplanes sp.]